MLIVGSTALHRIFGSDFREPKDLDVFARPESPYLTEQVVDRFWDERLAGSQLDFFGFANLHQMYTIKVSHAYWEIGNTWQKHMTDILFMKRNGAMLDMELHKLLYPIWQDKHGTKKMNLAQAAGDFFDDAVIRIYDHDSIHDSVAFGDKPLYERILKDGETVDIDPVKMWDGLTFDEQVLLFREEIAATALERWMIPTNYKFSPGRAYQMALRKTITSLTKGRSARFIVDNFEHFYKPHNYMKIHMAKRNKLIPLEGKNSKGMM